MTGTWKKLLGQAFKDTRVPTNSSNSCGLWNIRQYIYQVLQNAGIENRSPFTLSQLISIRYLSQGNPDQVRQLCIQTLHNMDRPAASFDRSDYLPFIFSILLVITFSITPKTATTFRAPVNGNSILVDKSVAIEDIDKMEIVLPSTSDYLTAANLYIENPVQPEHNSGLFGASWIQDQQDSTYSLQLLSASNTENLIKFCQKHRICDQSAYYESEVNGKKVYRLLYGVYSNHNAAKIAKSKLPDSLKKSSPWARKFKQIKREL